MALTDNTIIQQSVTWEQVMSAQDALFSGTTAAEPEEQITAYMDTGQGFYLLPEIAVAELLKAGVLVLHARARGTLVLAVQCSGIFHEREEYIDNLDALDIEQLYDFRDSDREWGVVKWCARHFDLVPLWSVAKEIIDAGKWDGAFLGLRQRCMTEDDGGWDLAKAIDAYNLANGIPEVVASHAPYTTLNGMPIDYYTEMYKNYMTIGVDYSIEVDLAEYANDFELKDIPPGYGV